MKKIILLFIFIYQALISRILKSILGVSSFCRFKPSCSEYARRAITRYGIFRGARLSLTRLLRCQPYGKYI
ncbi:MAG: membrane protein insertion efficiency factor YidD [Candidatus Levybacteria bacterium]|nr:membrane protein insertion efficiency factor YidD [Candidatus Levybacteria bacterium]